MSRIANVNIPKNKSLYISLCYIHGIGITSAKEICINLNIKNSSKLEDLTVEQTQKLSDYITSKYLVEGDLRVLVKQNIKRKKDIKCYQGIRHIKRLPVRGQRTHTNARTRKGKAIAITGKKIVR